MHHWQEETGIYTILVPWLDYTLTDHHVSYTEITRYYCTHERIEGATFIS